MGKMSVSPVRMDTCCRNDPYSLFRGCVVALTAVWTTCPSSGALMALGTEIMEDVVNDLPGQIDLILA
ncbi:hypothetical protein TNCV_481191 [Trichonephila clavipes]|nr:hypothetical protein TNCV_481191 [Trichonephila clavipes]